jgi:carbon monoxide dehydrogenase subunit G
MDMQGQRQLFVTQQQAWEALNNPDMLKACIPGCDKFEVTEAHVYNVGVAIKIGPVSAKFTGKVTLSDIQPPTSYALQFEAQGGVAGFGKGQSQVTLTPNPEGCELSYTVHSTVGGKLAQLGQRLIDGAAKSLAEDFFRRFDEALQAQYPRSEAATAPAAPTPAPASATPAWVWAVGGAVVVAALWYLTR